MADPREIRRPIRVCHILPALPLHGAEVLLLSICRHIDPSDARISILLVAKGGPLIPEFEALGIPVTLIPKKGRYDLSIIWKIRRFLKSGDFDIIHTHLFTANFWGRLGSLGVPIGRICSIHSIVSDKGTVLQRLQSFFDRALSRISDAVLCVTSQVMRSMREDAGLPREKLVTIVNGIPLPETISHLDKENARKNLDIPPDARVVGMIGRFSRPKNHRMLIESLSAVRERVPNLLVLLAGDGELEEEIRNLARSSGLEGAVRFLGLRRDIPAILTALDILVIPSLWEGLPIVLLEAMAFGTPVVATRVGGIPDVLTDGVTGVLAEPDAASFADRLSWALENPTEMERMSKAAFALAKNRYDVRQTAKSYVDLYRSTLRTRSFRRGLQDDVRSIVGSALSVNPRREPRDKSLRVLMYHRISRDPSRDILAVHPFAFREQLLWLREEGFRILSIRDAIEGLRNGRLEAGSVLLTFDDGYRDNYEEAFPILVRDRTPATIFPATGFVLGESVHPRYRDRTGDIQYLTPEQIREMSRNNIDFGGHTHSHALLTALSDDGARMQIRDSKKLLEDWIGKPVRHFAYPNGAFHPRHFGILETAGFETAFTVRPGTNTTLESPWTLRRTEISGRDSLPDFAAKLRGGFDAWHGFYQAIQRSRSYGG